GTVPDENFDELNRCSNMQYNHDTCVGECNGINNFTNKDQTYILYTDPTTYTNEVLTDDDFFDGLRMFHNERILHITNSCHAGTSYKMVDRSMDYAQYASLLLITIIP